MTIKPGREWGRPLTEPGPHRACSGDAELARRVAAGEPGPFSVEGGDLHRAIGVPQPPWRQIVPVDALEVVIDGHDHLAVAQVVARRPGRVGWWRGSVIAVCNVDYVGNWNVAPRAHPNDGRADVVEVAAAMGARARWQAWRRLAHGSHVPHPAISTRSVRQVEFVFTKPLGVWLDGIRAADRAHRLTVTVLPDAFELLV